MTLAPEIARGELATAGIGTEVFLLPAAGHAEKSGTFTQTQRQDRFTPVAFRLPLDLEIKTARGMTEENLKASLRDEWGNPTRAADLTSGMLRGGQQPLDIYRRIYGGINGTPMPGFGNQLSSEPETIWNLVAYVMSVSNRRRFGEAPPPGPMAPYVPAEAAESDGPRPTATQ